MNGFYGVCFRNFDRDDDIEFCRQLRNNPLIRKNLFYNKEISKEEHGKWVNSLTLNDYYFVVIKDRIHIGIVSFKILKDEPNVALPGSFFEPEYFGTDVPFRAGIYLGDLAFDKVEKLRCEIKPDNKSAINFNKAFGYELIEVKEDMNVYELKKEVYLEKRKNLVKMLGIEDGY